MATKGILWFTHDFNASDDEKMHALRAKYGWAGMGWYWYIIETLRGQPDFSINLDNKLLVAKISSVLDISCDHLIVFITDCTKEYQLFQCESNTFCSKSLNTRMKGYYKIVQKKKSAGKAGAQSRWNKNTTVESDETLTKKVSKKQNNVTKNNGTPMAQRWHSDGTAMADDSTAIAKHLSIQAFKQVNKHLRASARGSEIISQEEKPATPEEVAEIFAKKQKL